MPNEGLGSMILPAGDTGMLSQYFKEEEMSSTLSEHDAAPLARQVPGASFGEVPEQPRLLDRGMGVAVARRTVFRPGDNECFGRVADRVAAGNMSLAPNPTSADSRIEQARLRNAIATGALLTSGRHLQHGDHTQSGRNLEVFSNCASAITSFAKFYLLLNGAGVGRSYDDALMAVNWQKAPRILLYLSKEHPDYPHTTAAKCQFGISVGVLAHKTTEDPDGLVDQYIIDNFLSRLNSVPDGALYHKIGDSREGWAKALEIIEAMAFREETDKTLILDFSDVRPAGSPIAGMQNRPASGPISLMRVFLNIRNSIVNSPIDMPLWEQALRVDHQASIEVQVGGARRAARMATKDWRDNDILDFIHIKTKGGLWTANHSVMVDAEFWDLARKPQTTKRYSQRAHAVFTEVTRCAYINGEPGFINGDALEDHKTGTAWDKPVYSDGRDFRSNRYQADHATDLLADLSRRANVSSFPVTVNPCAEVTLHTTGGYCVVGDYAPLLACPVAFDTLTPGLIPDDIATLWDARIEDSVRLGVRLLLRVNLMDSLYGIEIERTNRIGIGPSGLHEYAWLRFGFDFNDLLNEEISAPFWEKIEQYSIAAKEEANAYAAQLGRKAPVTITTCKPAGTTSKLFGITEGAHLPARQQYLRWVQFKGTRDPSDGSWYIGSDPLLQDYKDRGYPIRELQNFPGMTIVGFPTVPLLTRLSIGHRCVTANDAPPEDQYKWLRLLEKYWIGEDQGNQISYTLKIFTNTHDLDTFRTIVLNHQPTIRCCAILPSKPDHELGYEYLPEESLTLEEFSDIVLAINDKDVKEDIDLAHLQCASGACPI